MEIKFRGKRIDNGEWVYGFLFELSTDGCSITCIGTEPLSANDYSEIYKSCYEEVIPETVGQYTGLKDKNGVEIYEGDILYILQTGAISNSFEAHDENRKVLFYEGSFCIENYTKYENVDIENHYGIGLYHTPDELEVVGNIYENPEMLKKEQK